MNFYEFISRVRISYDYYCDDYDLEDENYTSCQLDFESTRWRWERGGVLYRGTGVERSIKPLK